MIEVSANLAQPHNAESSQSFCSSCYTHEPEKAKVENLFWQSSILPPGFNRTALQCDALFPIRDQAAIPSFYCLTNAIINATIETTPMPTVANAQTCKDF